MRTIRATTTSNRRTTTSATVSGWERRSSTVSAQASSIRFRIIMRSPRRISTDGSQSASTSYAITTKAGRTVIHGKSSTGKSGTNPMPNRTCGAVTTNCIMSCMRAPQKRIKERFSYVKVGGPALSCPVQYDAPLKYTDDFLEYCRKENAPLDFYSWHCYPTCLEEIVDEPARVRNVLDRFGFTETELHLNEWHYVPTWEYSAKAQAPVSPTPRVPRSRRRF